MPFADQLLRDGEEKYTLMGIYFLVRGEAFTASPFLKSLSSF